ncbi:metallophosphoesterase [Haloarchaeobius salinus]|uniref:metallophosphoesterase n=1 Tax=Haloarchaeobius salinus TaxID=1198298 RepID=UPI00210EF366|nr:metallophosphoesterase [Haloarchaeobius salinus]
MLVVCSDTHSHTGHALTGRTREAVATADLVVHAGDFVSPDALDAFYEVAPELRAVHGNADTPAVTERLPTARVVDYEGVRIAVTHRRDGGATGLRMFGRGKGADLVVSGHTHRPTVVETGDVTLLNPGSHAQPRGNRPGHAELEPTDDGLSGRIVQPDGTLVAGFSVSAGGRDGQD